MGTLGVVMTVADEVREAVARLQAMGANVRLGPPNTDGEIAAAEAALGFSLPDEYKEFLRDIGRIEIELVRTWFFYGLPEQPEVKKLYQDVFAVYAGADDDDARGPYAPRRFVVLADEGNYANVGEGFVWDGDLSHIRATAGDEYIERSEFSPLHPCGA